MAAMSPPGGGRNSVTNRYLRHFSVVSVTAFDGETMSTIFNALVDWWMKRTGGDSPPEVCPSAVRGCRTTVACLGLPALVDWWMKRTGGDSPPEVCPSAVRGCRTTVACMGLPALVDWWMKRTGGDSPPEVCPPAVRGCRTTVACLGLPALVDWWMKRTGGDSPPEVCPSAVRGCRTTVACLGLPAVIAEHRMPANDVRCHLAALLMRQQSYTYLPVQNCRCACTHACSHLLKGWMAAQRPTP